MDTVLALDVGTKRIGIARGNMRARIANPLVTISRKSVKKDVQKVSEICRREKAVAVVVGLAFLEDGSEGRSARLSRQIGEGLAEELDIQVHYHDESYSSVEAQRRLRSLGASPKKQKNKIDEIAAAVILEDWFLEQPE